MSWVSLGYQMMQIHTWNLATWDYKEQGSVMGLQGARVSNLMCVNSKEWERDIIKEMFEERDRNLIYSIPLGERANKDGWYWKEEHYGEYSVKSALKLLQRINNRWDDSDNVDLWKKVWKLGIPTKIKNFMWRALSDCLPSRSNLREKRVQVSNECPACRMDIESTYHCLVQCMYAKSCWSVVIPDIDCTTGNSFMEWYEGVVNKHRTLADVVAVVCWGIWKARNEIVWNGKFLRAGWVVANAKAYLAQWKSVQNMGVSGSSNTVVSTENIEQWTKPGDNCVKVNCDASISRERLMAGVGWIARDFSGMLIEAVATLHNEATEIRIAEAIAIREALSWVKNQTDLNWPILHDRPTTPVIESDSQVAVLAINSTSAILSPFGVIIDDCRMLVSQIRNVSIRFVKQSGNRAADFVARLSVSNPGRIARGGYVPSELKAIIEAHLS